MGDSKCIPKDKRAMWIDLIQRRTLIDGNVLCILGNFNSTCSSSERIGGESSEHRVGDTLFVEFNNFISHMELLDLPILGWSFTWF